MRIARHAVARALVSLIAVLLCSFKPVLAEPNLRGGIRVDVDGAKPECISRADTLTQALRDEGYVVNHVQNRRTGTARVNEFKYVEAADGQVGRILRIAVRHLGGEAFDQISPTYGRDVGAAEAVVLISLYGKC